MIFKNRDMFRYIVEKIINFFQRFGDEREILELVFDK